jgi:hypothetical protein
VDIAHVTVTDTDDGRKQLVVAVILDDAGAVQVADLLTRLTEATAEDVQARIKQPARRTPAKKATPRGRGGRK